ncbi:MarR family winged helix-turn-helix transcriptional regulator [Geothrix sp. 21YS21S-2]|uniref:MarR family winged helix-turn-helix transcriptional regulator n=1 Tax=Geothrix sp. 21YS21S-2 TaxID=3068893 RepID=UPI0027B8F803|nr:MarR family transcriptional regulator [Geothrix sp. 21YS21S-2]
MTGHRRGGFLIAKIHRIGGRIFARMLRERGIELDPAHGRVLFVLWEEGPMTIFELAKRVSLGKSTLTHTVDRLEAAGQIVRVRSAEDRRKVMVELTPGNQELQALYGTVSQEMTDLFYGGFSEEEADRFDAHLGRVLANLERA